MKKEIGNIKRVIKTKFKRKSNYVKNSFYSLSKKMKYLKLMHWTYPKKIFLGILIILILGACLLYCPFSFNYESYQYVNNEYIFQFKNNLLDYYVGLETKEIHYNFIDALFMASSAFTDTGFSIITVGSDLSAFGQVVIYTLIQIGGFGYISLFYLIGKALRNITKKNLFSTSLLNIERGGTKISNSSAMITKIFLVILSLQLFFAFLLSGVFYAYPFKIQQSWEQLIKSYPIGTEFSFSINGKDYVFNISDNNINNLISLTFDNVDGAVIPAYHNFGLSLWYSLFLCGSAINNAGFDLFGSTSLQLFRNDIGIFIQFIILILVVIGGIGFPVIYDLSLRFQWFLKYKISYKIMHKQIYAHIEKPRFGSFTKMCLWSCLIVSLISIAVLFFTEYAGKNSFTTLDINNVQNYFSIINFPEYVTISPDTNSAQTIHFFGSSPELNKNLSIIFTALSTRSAGFSTVDIVNFTEPSIIVLSILMFIGASPSSTGGGIRTTTLTVILKSMLSWLRGLNTTSFAKRRIPYKTVSNAYLIFVVSMIMLILMSLLLYITSEIEINGKNLVAEEFKNKSIYYGFSYFFFECASAFGTTGLTVGIVNSQYIQWWNLLILIVLMFIGQLGISSTLLIFARKVPKKIESAYLEENVRLG